MGDNLDVFMHAIRIQESGDDYTAVNASGHFGAYQFGIGTWIEALADAGLQYTVFSGTLPNLAPPSVQDAAARALMSRYLGQFGGSLYNVAEAWYGGPGAVGHPNEGGGPGYPTVGEYASQVMAIYARLGGQGGSTGTTGGTPPVVDAATIAGLDLALSAEMMARGLGDTHSREQAAAGDAAEAVTRAEGDAHSREQAAAGDRAEAVARVEAVNHTRQQLAAAVLLEAQQRITGDDHTRQQLAAQILLAQQQRATGDADSREQAAAGDKALHDQLSASIANVLKYAQSLPGLIDTRAANGYDPTLRARATLLTRLLDTVTAHNPAVAGLVSDLAKFAVELAGIDDPLLKIAATLLLKQVIDRLGVDTALQAMLSDLLGGIIGGGQPKTLQDITADIGNRLDALEAGQAALSPLAPEADQLHELGTLIFDAGLLAYLTAAVVDPVSTADDTVGVLAPVTGPLLEPVRMLLGIGA